MSSFLDQFTPLFSLNIDESVKSIFIANSLSLKLLCISALLIGYEHYLISPIKCELDNTPATALATSMCLTKSLYTEDTSSSNVEVIYARITKSFDKDKRYYNNYSLTYKYLLVQAIVFVLPAYFRIFLEKEFWNDIIDETNRRFDRANPKKTFAYLNSHLGHLRSYAINYCICELLCLLNVIGQFYFTAWYLGGDYLSYGIDVIRHALNTTTTALSYHPNELIFPLMAKCDYRSSTNATIETKTLLCSLEPNLTTSRIYLIIWFWFALLLVLYSSVLLNRLVILFAWRWRGHFLSNNHLNKRHILKLNRICEHNIGDYFLIARFLPRIDRWMLDDFIKSVESELNLREIISLKESENSETEQLNTKNFAFHTTSGAKRNVMKIKDVEPDDRNDEFDFNL